MDPRASPVAATGVSPLGESKAQEQARLRRERRNAKIIAGGSDRLNKISSLSGRPAELINEADRISQTPPARPSAPTPSRESKGYADDPPAVDISSMFQRPPETPPPNPQDLFRQMFAAGGMGPGQPDFAQGDAPVADDNDPMMRMMQQLLGGMGADGSGSDGPGNGQGGLPPGLAEMFAGMQAQPEPDRNVNQIWRIVHALLSLSLGLYAAIYFAFSGSQSGRIAYPSGGTPAAPRLFWLFATMELILQSSRYFINGGKLPRSGILSGLGNLLPEPYGNYLRIFMRYSIIYTTIASDAMVIVFVLGLMAWWRGLAAS